MINLLLCHLSNRVKPHFRLAKQYIINSCLTSPILICSTRESERRLDLVMEKSEVVDVLQQLGHLLQEERHLSEQLKGQASTNR